MRENGRGGEAHRGLVAVVVRGLGEDGAGDDGEQTEKRKATLQRKNRGTPAWLRAPGDTLDDGEDACDALVNDDFRWR